MIRLNRKMRKILSARKMKCLTAFMNNKWRCKSCVRVHITMRKPQHLLQENPSCESNDEIKPQIIVRRSAVKVIAKSNSQSHKKIVGMLQNFLLSSFSINRKNMQESEWERNKIIIDHNCIIGKVNLLWTYEKYWVIWIFT